MSNKPSEANQITVATQVVEVPALKDRRCRVHPEKHITKASWKAGHRKDGCALCVKTRKKKQREFDRRFNTKVWFPTVDDLQLPDVPAEAHDAVRECLRPYLGRIAVRSCDCWNIAQKLMLTVNSPRVHLVEGVWLRDKTSGCYFAEDEKIPEPHAWNTVDNFLVDLVAEFYYWNSFGTDSPWLHEPFKEYTLADIQRYVAEIGDLDGLSISTAICAQGWQEQFGLPGVFTYTESATFEATGQRLLHRISRYAGVTS